MLLEVEELDVRYGRNHAIKALDLELAEGEIVTVLGANGAGKSSLLKAVQGTVKPAGGSVRLNGETVTGWSSPKRVRAGLTLVPEGRQIFVSLTVHENLQMGAYSRSDHFDREIDEVYDRFPNLAARRDMMASVLSGGEQQMLAISRALLAKPRIMMLDEPSLGLSPILVQSLFDLIADLNRDGLTILLVEQNTHMALQTAHRGYVLELGATVLSGTAEELLADDRLEEAYLGGN
ncbi:MAG: ABC transporter ATP-binding protein [Rhodospirillaceae bacterium]|nr:ABC transporter ATP-binding protein [Rhodospirillaceae bacterium]MDE0253831.1 ABC transporter ATP-binding protein [Rhodospirillaceae bacterium]MDE0618430.1 ABC transporter ATP-binding protein [Rhodospirillaceae bacterium]MYF06726.1 ABC transporter ATP-binding protein [Rhodospirillaceae bacterium]MYJ72739.1 ABC transporter ATP-binding protein [Rhodospirillaceae bacterium]